MLRARDSSSSRPLCIESPIALRCRRAKCQLYSQYNNQTSEFCVQSKFIEQPTLRTLRTKQQTRSLLVFFCEWSTTGMILNWNTHKNLFTKCAAKQSPPRRGRSTVITELAVCVVEQLSTNEVNIVTSIHIHTLELSHVSVEFKNEQKNAALVLFTAWRTVIHRH